MRGLTRVSIGLETSSNEIEALEQVFAAAQIPVVVDPQIARFSADSPWVMYLSAPVSAFSSQFARVESPHPEAWRGLKHFMDRTAEAFGGQGGSVVFTEEKSEVMIALTPDLPDQAYSDLLELDLEEIEGQRISWDPDEQAWYGLRGTRCSRRSDGQAEGFGSQASPQYR
jgi:hypothetical protein